MTCARRIAASGSRLHNNGQGGVPKGVNMVLAADSLVQKPQFTRRRLDDLRALSQGGGRSRGFGLAGLAA
jgi:hypothetical protein